MKVPPAGLVYGVGTPHRGAETSRALGAQPCTRRRRSVEEGDLPGTRLSFRSQSMDSSQENWKQEEMGKEGSST